jgi:hypothetical protein
VRTTVDIPDTLYRRLKAKAAEDGTSAKALILKGVVRVLDDRKPSTGVRVRLPLVAAKRPGTVRLDNARIYDVISFP